jgi:hypothetical protein
MPEPALAPTYDPPPPPPSPPSATLTLEAPCARRGAALPGQPAPDAALLGFVTAHPWCREGGGEETEVLLRADGTLRETRRAPSGQEVNTGEGCWALGARTLWLHGGADRWDGWDVRAEGEALIWRDQPWTRCGPHEVFDPNPGH